MSIQIAHQVTLDTEECCSCGIVFAMPASLQQRARANGITFYCPNGHPQSYTESEVQRLRTKLTEQARIATEQTARAARAELAQQTAEKEAQRLRKRVRAGMCICCNRTFQNLARHMATKHKEAETK